MFDGLRRAWEYFGKTGVLFDSIGQRPVKNDIILNKNGDFRDLYNDRLEPGNFLPEDINENNIIEIDYFSYVSGLPLLTADVEFKRSGIQSPFRRLLSEIRKRL